MRIAIQRAKMASISMRRSKKLSVSGLFNFVFIFMMLTLAAFAAISFCPQ
jgi:hypothetical protein